MVVIGDVARSVVEVPAEGGGGTSVHDDRLEIRLLHEVDLGIRPGERQRGRANRRHRPRHPRECVLHENFLSGPSGSGHDDGNTIPPFPGYCNCGPVQKPAKFGISGGASLLFPRFYGYDIAREREVCHHAHLHSAHLCLWRASQSRTKRSRTDEVGPLRPLGRAWLTSKRCAVASPTRAPIALNHGRKPHPRAKRGKSRSQKPLCISSRYDEDQAGSASEARASAQRANEASFA